MKKLFQNKGITRKKIIRYFYSISITIFLASLVLLFIFIKKNVYEVIENGQVLAEMKIKTDFVSLNMSQEKFDKLVFDIDNAVSKIEQKETIQKSSKVKNPFY